jgi:hypothetical protein
MISTDSKTRWKMIEDLKIEKQKVLFGWLLDFLRDQFREDEVKSLFLKDLLECSQGHTSLSDMSLKWQPPREILITGPEPESKKE